jgi:hypothetical protein
VKGNRKYRFALFALAGLIAGFGVAALMKSPVDLYDAFVWGLVGLVVGHGGTNGIEHLSEALRARGQKK